jgi:hypothetical protein
LKFFFVLAKEAVMEHEKIKMASVFYNMAEELDLEEPTLEDMTAALKAWPRFHEIKRGDIVCLDTEDDRYRNTDCYIWDGEALVDLDDVDEYGNVPPSFVITDTDFSPDYWISSVAHNGIFWLSPEIIQRMNFAKDEKGVLSSPVKIGDKTWTCIVDYPRGVPRKHLNDLANTIYKKTNGHVFVFTRDSNEHTGHDYDSTFFLSCQYDPRNYETDVVE